MFGEKCHHWFTYLLFSGRLSQGRSVRSKQRSRLFYDRRTVFGQCERPGLRFHAENSRSSLSLQCRLSSRASRVDVGVGACTGLTDVTSGCKESLPQLQYLAPWFWYIALSFSQLVFTVTLWRPLLPYGYSYKEHPVPDLVKLWFAIFDTWALWHSALSVRVPRCQKLQMTA